MCVKRERKRERERERDSEWICVRKTELDDMLRERETVCDDRERERERDRVVCVRQTDKERERQILCKGRENGRLCLGLLSLLLL